LQVSVTVETVEYVLVLVRLPDVMTVLSTAVVVYVVRLLLLLPLLLDTPTVTTGSVVIEMEPLGV